MTNRTLQHWVPQFYLRGFHSSVHRGNYKVWAFSRTGGDPFETSISNILAERKLYPIETDERLKGIENLLGRIWNPIATDFVDLESEPLRKALALFVATLYLRNRVRIRDYKHLHADLVAQFDALPKDELGRPAINQIVTNDEAREFDRSGWDEYQKWSEEDHRAFFAHALTDSAGDIAEQLLQKRWAVVVHDDDVFATSDAPVTLTNSSQVSFGFGSPGTSVRLPLSPTRCLVMDNRSEPQGYFASSPDFPDAMNYQTWIAADQFLLSRTPSDAVIAGLMRFADGNRLP